MLLNSGIGQGLFFAGNKHVAIQIIASYGEDKLVTTNPEELLKAEAEEVEYEGAEEEVPAEPAGPDLGPASEDVGEAPVEAAPVAETAPPEMAEAAPIEEAPTEAEPPTEEPPAEEPPPAAPPAV